MKAYSLVLLILVSVLTIMLVTRKDVTATITRASGQLYQKRDSLQITNLYNIKVANKTHEAFPIHLKLENIDGEIQMIGKELSIEKETLAEGTFLSCSRELRYIPWKWISKLEYIAMINY